ncbi:aspartic peptidase domain-containing protein [Xylogone sp. PMI_703]|nr:aspartic peptidase domain-containing protein [Xylogone sp. PMI_703]
MRFIAMIIWIFTILIARALSANSTSNSTTLQPIVIGASQHFEGNDGPWSTFDIRVGTPEQDIRVLVSTASPEVLVPLSPYACSTSEFVTVPSDCAVSRGNLFDLNKSSSWLDAGSYGINQDGFGLEANLGYVQPAQFGLEHLGIGLTGPSLSNQTVAGIATPEPFYLGIFGLNNQPLNFSELGNYSAPSFLTTLKDQKKIPSLSWSYTAGAQYRLKQVYGQLIFSGYDTSRFTENSVSFTMADDITRDLVVSLHSISYNGGNSATLLSNSIDIFIDSTDPNLWLPDDAVDAFETAFGLTLDNTTGLYLVNDTHHNALLDTNAEVTFRLSDVKSGGDTVSITLPYAAFDLTADYPLVANKSNYFPLKRANSSAQYTLGRTFLQEAYLSADYERKVFNVSACVWNEGAQENIVTITSKDSDSSDNSNSTSGGSGNGGGNNSGNGNPNSSKGSHLSGGAIAGIVIGCVAAVFLVAAAVAIFVLRKRRKWLKAGYAVAAPKIEPDEAVLKGPVFNAAPGTTDSSTPFSAADISATRSSAGNSGSAEDSPAALAAVAAAAAPIVAASSGTRGPGDSTPELDGRHLRPNSELDGREIPSDPSNPVAQNPGVYELPGSEGDRLTRPSEPNREISTVGDLPLFGDRQKRNDSPPSPYVSTLGSNNSAVDEGEYSDNIVSPATPSRNSRVF